MRVVSRPSRVCIFTFYWTVLIEAHKELLPYSAGIERYFVIQRSGVEHTRSSYVDYTNIHYNFILNTNYNMDIEIKYNVCDHQPGVVLDPALGKIFSEKLVLRDRFDCSRISPNSHS